MKYYLVFIITLIACSNIVQTEDEAILTGSVTDIDGNVYKTVKIGNQWWMAENLRVTHYRNGDYIPYVILNDQWYNLLSGAYCEYDCNKEDRSNEEYVQKYGRLYNWYVLSDGRGIAPKGWHVPTDDDWKMLESYIGIEDSLIQINGWRGVNVGNELKSDSGWFNNGNGSNIWGFNAIPGGNRYIDGKFIELEHGAYFWTSTESQSNHAWHRQLRYDLQSLYYNDKNKKRGFSIRCIKD